MKDEFAPMEQHRLRPPEEVMRLRRMGAMMPTRLSFLRVLTRRLAEEGAQLRRPVWEIDAEGYGHAVYTIAYGGHDYSLVAVSTYLPDEMRTDRVIATAWDTTYVLYDGVPDADEIARIVANAPKQEAGRFTERDLVLSRANKSVRLFAHVVDALRAGHQPDRELVGRVGYLMRTTAVYGNGKFGIADRNVIAERPGLGGPFAAEMLAVWLIRSFTHDLAEHLGGAPLDRAIKRQLGIGNATGLGMAPFLVSHPVLLNNWMMARETALARVRALPRLTPEQAQRLQALMARARRHLDSWHVPDPGHEARLDVLRSTLEAFGAAHFRASDLEAEYPLDRILRAAAGEPELEELLVALLIEPFGDLVDGLADCMADPAGMRALPFAGIADLRRAISAHFGWATEIAFDDPDQEHQFWYVSEEKQEPRLGLRHAEPGADRESPLDIARRVQALWRDLPEDGDLRAFRAAHPEHELALFRVTCADHHPYSEIRDNLIGKACLPIDMLRCKLSFFGATRFDPKSDRWTRVTLAQGAPLGDELTLPEADDWWLPEALA